jgi:hypothetical protein
MQVRLTKDQKARLRPKQQGQGLGTIDYQRLQEQVACLVGHGSIVVRIR